MYLLLHEMMHLAFPSALPAGRIDLDQALAGRLGLSRRNTAGGGTETWSQAVSRYFNSACDPKEVGP